jgi:predicted metal-dependent phosphoesterase TrpH
VTDHDTIEGIAPAAAAAESQGVHLVPGIELSVTLDGDEIHLLAYGIDPGHAGLRQHLAAMQEARRERASMIVERLRDHGVEIEDEQLRADIASVHAVGRPHVAAALVRGGHVRTERAAFEQYLGEGKPGYVAKPAFPAADALSLVHEAGGVGVLAHPGHWTSSTQVRRLADAGLDGLETRHPSHDASLRGYYERLAQGYDLLTTGGSDYHGRTRKEDERFGTMGMTCAEWERFRAALP